MKVGMGMGMEDHEKKRRTENIKSGDQHDQTTTYKLMILID